MLGFFLKTALRNLTKHKYQSILNILGMSIGFAAFLYISAHIFHEFSFDRFNTKADRIFRAVLNLKFGDTDEITSRSEMPLAAAAKQDLPEVEETVRLYSLDNMIVWCSDKQFTGQDVWFSEPSLFKIFNFRLLEGDPKTALSEPNTIVLDRKAVTRFFGKDDPMGKTLLLGNNKKSYMVTGILADIPENSHLQFDMLASFTSLPKEKLSEGWAQSIDISTYILVKKGTNLENFKKKYASFPMKYLRTTVAKMGMTLDEFEKRGNYLTYGLQPLKDIHLHSSQYHDDYKTAGNIRFVFILGLIGILILIVACLNFINLSTSKAALRTKEIAVRKINGAIRKQVVYHIFTETFLQCFLALLLAVFILLLILPLLNNLFEITVKPEFFLNPFSILTLVILPLLITILAGSYPAFYITRFRSVEIMKRVLVQKGRRNLSRDILVTSQFVIFITLVFSTLIVMKQVFLLQHRNPGYNKNNVLVIKGMFNMGEDNRMSFKNEIQTIASVQSASYSSTVPTLNEDSKMIYRLRGDEKYAYFNYMRVDTDFQKTLGIRMKSGYFFRKNTDTINNYILINEAAARVLGIKDYTVQRIHCDNMNQDYQIIGIVKDFHMKSLRDNSFPLVLHPVVSENYLSIRLQPGDPARVISSVKKLWKQYIQDAPFEYFFLDQSFNAQYKSEKRLKKLISGFTAIAILIACMGLLGLVSFNTTLRIKEIGIRKVNGAKIAEILMMLNNYYVRLVSVSYVIACPIAWYVMHKWLQNFALKTDLSWWVYASAGILALFLAMMTVSVQSFRAATMNPVEALRYE